VGSLMINVQLKQGNGLVHDVESRKVIERHQGIVYYVKNKMNSKYQYVFVLSNTKQQPTQTTFLKGKMKIYKTPTEMLTVITKNGCRNLSQYSDS
jgi:methyl coenzyme M reductase gamma subunit